MNLFRHRFELAALVCSLLAVGTLPAAVARFHYVPADNSGKMVLPAGSGGQTGEHFGWFGIQRQPCCQPPRPTRMMTFCHPFTGRPAIVPLALPAGTPNIEHSANRIVYNYGSYTVQVIFLADGSVDVIYNSGFLREL
jgi:hypothetical protein